MADSTAWLPDAVLPGFETLTIPFPADYDGPVVATLVRRLATDPTRRAVLYIHGFIDYFFQAHLAEAYNVQGWNFYALDLRKHGRSIRPGQHANFAKDMREYFADITAAIVLIKGQESNTTLLLNGHSTGGLIAALYADSGRLRDQIDALFLNSPFLGWNVSALEAFGLKLFGALQKNVLGLTLCITFGVLCFIAIALLRLPLVYVLLGLGGLACAVAYKKLAP